MANILATKATQKGAPGLTDGFFNGDIAITAMVADPDRLTFYANIAVKKEDDSTVEYTACSSNGKVRKFTDLDDVIKWVRGTYVDIVNVSYTVDGMDEVTKNFKVPTDPLKDAESNKKKYLGYSEKHDSYIADAQTDIARAEGLGWNDPAAHQSLQDLHADYVARKAFLEAEKAYFTARIAFYQGIIDLG